MCRGGACRGGARDESASELSEQFGNADGDQAECGGAAVAGALPGGCGNATQVTAYNCRSSVKPGMTREAEKRSRLKGGKTVDQDQKLQTD